MRWHNSPFALLLLAGCDAQPVLDNPVACQQRIVDVRRAQQLGTDGSSDIARGFTQLAKAYAAVETGDCSEAQKRKLLTMREKAAELATLAEAATRADRSAAARNSRLPHNEEQIAFMSALQGFENRQALLRRELREMRAGK